MRLFLGVQLAITILHVFGQKTSDFAGFFGKNTKIPHSQIVIYAFKAKRILERHGIQTSSHSDKS